MTSRLKTIVSNKSTPLRSAFVWVALIGSLTFSGAGVGNAGQKGWSSGQDQLFRQNFSTAFGQPRDDFSTIDEYLDYFDYDRYLGNGLTNAIAEMEFGSRPVMWSMDYWMISMVEAYEGTGNVYYLEELLRTIRAVLAYRDDQRGAMLFDGTIAPVWATTIYSEGNGRRYYTGHSGMITYPMFAFLDLFRREPELYQKLGDEYDSILETAQETLDYHERDWNDGPGLDEGHYFNHPDSEHRPQYQNIPQPGNLLSAMGRALWMSWVVSGDTQHRDRTLQLGRYLKNRISLATDGAYYWEYQLPTNPVTTVREKKSIISEDVGHAFLTVSFPILLASYSEVFDQEDMLRFSQTVKQGFGRFNDGVLLGEVNGSPLRFDTVSEIRGSVLGIFGWARLTPWDPEVYQRVVDFYLKYHSQSDNHIDNAVLIRYKPDSPGQTPTLTSTPSPTLPSTSTRTPTASGTFTPTASATATDTSTPSPTPTNTKTPSPTFTSTATPSETPTKTLEPGPGNPLFEFSLTWRRGEPEVGTGDLLNMLGELKR
jgi:hypothetical protein